MHRPDCQSSNSINVALGAIVSVCVILPLVTAPVAADDWPFFRGPHNNGVSFESGWLVRWPESGPRVAWRKDLGIGASSFAVVNNRVISMGNQQDTDIVWCLDADSGRVIWQFDYPCKFVDHNFEGGTSSTPTVDGSFVYTLGYDGQVHCLNIKNGQLVWRRHLVHDFGGRYSSWDYAGSPLVTGDRIIFDTGADGNSTVALDKTNGQKVWGVGEDLAGYATPIPFEHAGMPAVLVFKARAMVAHDLADGRELWRISWKTNYDVNASTPTVVGDKLFVSSGYGGKRARGALFQLKQSEPRQIWVNGDIETKMNSAVVHDGHVYCISERAGGQLMCVDLLSGTTVWAERSFAKYGALMIADGKLVIVDEEGDLVIAEATSDEYRELARTTVLSGRCWAMPVLSNGRIYVRNNKGKMACLDVRR
jgi:outer membrane protein assembly factor BamB